MREPKSSYHPPQNKSILLYTLNTHSMCVCECLWSMTLICLCLFYSYALIILILIHCLCVCLCVCVCAVLLCLCVLCMVFKLVAFRGSLFPMTSTLYVTSQIDSPPVIHSTPSNHSAQWPRHNRSAVNISITISVNRINTVEIEWLWVILLLNELMKWVQWRWERGPRVAQMRRG